MSHVLFLLHGIGDFENGDPATGTPNWTEKIEHCLLTAAENYPGFNHDDLIFQPLTYDDVFDRQINTLAKLGDKMAGTLFQPVTNWMSGAADPNFLWEALGDVVQYRGLGNVRTNIITKVSEQIVDTIEDHGVDNTKYSILCHSLGTAVGHDSLQKIASGPINGNMVAHPSNFRFSNFFALANVSRLVWATTDGFYSDTRVRPRNSGMDNSKCCIKKYVNFRHIADPVPSFIRFQPVDWDPGRYTEINVRHLRAANVHGFTHYLDHPQVSGAILNRVLGDHTIDPVKMNEHIAAYPDFKGDDTEAQERLVTTVAATLDDLSPQADADIDLNLIEFGKLLLENKEILKT